MQRLVLVVVTLAAACSGSTDDRPPDAPLASCKAAPAAATGEGTYYAADGTGSCSFDASADRQVAALNGADYAHAGWCGACLAVTGPMGTTVVRVVDQCPGCAHGDLDLSKEAFARIAPLAAGRVPISWELVECEVAGPLGYRFKDGSNAYWTAIQLRDHRYPIATLEAKDASGAYQPIARADYNYFVAPAGLGPGPYALRVTDTRGHVVEDPAIALGAAVTRPSSAQLPRCP